MRIYIPSRSRARAFLKPACTIMQLRGAWPVSVVVPAEQVPQYTAALNNEIGSGGPMDSWTHLPEIISFGSEEDEGGIGEVRRRCGEHARYNRDRKFFMMDDDIRFYIRRTPGKTNLLNIETANEVRSMLSQVRRLLETHSAVGISPREGNNHVKEDAAENTRLCRAWGCVVEDFLACEHSRVQWMEDFDIMLQLLRAGKPNISLSVYAQGQGGSQAPGGCSDYRTLENHNAAAHALHELHPKFTKLRQKENKTGGEFGTRTEVTIYWKKAFASSGVQS